MHVLHSYFVGQTCVSGLLIHYVLNIHYLSFTGANRITLVGQNIINPVGLAVFGEFLYWADRDAQIIARVDKLTGDGWTKVIGDVSPLSDIISVDGDLQGKY